MPILINLHLLAEEDLHLVGELTPQEVEFELNDEMIRVDSPLQYDLAISYSGENILVQGRIALQLNCECVRCLRSFQELIEIDPWDLLVPLDDEDSPEIVDDCVDIIPYLRENALLAFPRHPLCSVECKGLTVEPPTNEATPGTSPQAEEKSSAWGELDKLKLK